ncbi:MAG: alanyl-tRNA editing protein [Halanaeroarchaeum sp.]
MTEAVYLDDSTERTFEATVERVLDDRVVLNRTLFYPEGGGQPNDEGVLVFDGETVPVVDVQETDEIYHTLDGPVPDAGAAVKGRIDWNRRFAHMRYHTAQHLLSAVLLASFDARTTGNQLYADRARIDVAYDRFTEEDFATIEERVQAYVEEDLSVEGYTMDRERAEAALDTDRTRLDLLPDGVTEVRIVEIGDVDRTACAGTHVPSTGQIGTFEITGRETKGSDEERLRFVLH